VTSELSDWVFPQIATVTKVTMVTKVAWEIPTQSLQRAETLVCRREKRQLL
jgi:hypothetical protein